MKNKYVVINGMAFSEESDMEKLNKYANQGWILESVVGGFFYKLRKDEPQDLIYNLDYQTETNEEYFTIFKEAGWSLVLSVGNYIHIFSAQAGTNPIYSDRESEIDKYTSIRDKMKKGSLYSFILAIILIILSTLPVIDNKFISKIIFGLLIIDICVFVFNFMPYVAYNSKIKKIELYGECNNKK